MTRRVAPRGVRRTVDAGRSDAERLAMRDLERWQKSAIPDITTPLEADDLVRLLRDCIGTMGLDAAIVADVSVNTVHYYRRRDIIDPPIGRTVSARYSIRHLWQVAGARLAGHLGLVTLAEARDVIRSSDEATSMEFLAARVADVRARSAVRGPSPTKQDARDMRPLKGTSTEHAADATKTRATVVTLPGNAWCVIPATHAAFQSTEAANALVRALGLALGTVKYS